jgi:catechol 2,3-dioxygenase-like lactoylglutathione lyase family enzyme
MNVRLDLVGIVVADMAASLAFYRRLGLDLPAEADDQPHVELPLPGGLRLAWDTVDVVRSFDPGWAPASGGHRVALAFHCDDAPGVDAVHDRLVAAGHASHLAPWDAFWGQRYAVVHDPDGNHVELFAPLPDPSVDAQSS